MKKHKKRRLPARVEQVLELPAGTLTDGVRMEVTGNRRAVIEGCQRVLEYEEGLIRIQTAGGDIRFMGHGLCMNCLTPAGIVITGSLLSIEYV